MIFFIYTCTLHVHIFTIKLCHDFTINLSHKSHEINCLTISGYYLVNRLAKIQICEYVHYSDSITCCPNHGRNLVGDTGDVSPPSFFSLGFVFGEVSKTKVMFVTFCVKSFSCYMAGHIHSQADVETEFGVVSLILLVYKF